MATRLPVYEGSDRGGPRPVPAGDAAAPIRDRLASGRQRLDASHPETLDLTAELLALLHRELRGEVALLARELERGERYLRGQLLGEHGLVLEDLVLLARLRPEVLRRALAMLLPPAEDERPARLTLCTAAAALARSAGALNGTLAEVLDDGQVTLTEIDSCLQDLDQVEQACRDARVTLLRRGR